MVRFHLIALGHLSIALSAIMGNNLFFIGLMFIVLGSGLFKTCISVMVGTLYKKDVRRSSGFSLFYRLAITRIMEVVL